MRFNVDRDALLTPLQLMLGVVGRRQAEPVLSHVLFGVNAGELLMIGSDQSLELKARLSVELWSPGEIALPARKLFEICRYVESGEKIEFSVINQDVVVTSGQFRSRLKGLPGHDFPQTELSDIEIELSMPGAEFRRLVGRVEFSMASQDVRYFFNGMLLEFEGAKLNAVATNGQRLARAETLVEPVAVGHIQAIVPRKAVSELLRFIRAEDQLSLIVSSRHLRVDSGPMSMTTRLVDADYPDYRKAIPQGGDKTLEVSRVLLKEALKRMAIVSNELYHNVRFQISANQLVLSASNGTREDAEETLNVSYLGDEVDIAFNVNYVIEVLAALGGEIVQLNLRNGSSAVVLRDPSDDSVEYVISPMMIE